MNFDNLIVKCQFWINIIVIQLIYHLPIEQIMSDLSFW